MVESTGSAFYLQPLSKPMEDCWFVAKPVGQNTLENMVRDMCKAAGIAGYKTNHSLRATTATRLFQAGVDKQLIMECTGHKSIDGVRSYKRMSSEQQVALSDKINLRALEPKWQHVASSAITQAMAPAQLSLQDCGTVTININYGNI